jgi:RNA polymerase sigma factor (TIGR02999 family)
MNEAAPSPDPDRPATPDLSIDALFAQCYDELRVLARRALAGERKDHTLQPTDLVHEAYALLKRGGSLQINDRLHFIRLTARAMRRHLVDYARKRKSDKGGGELTRVTFTGDLGQAPDQFDLIPLGRAMERLESLHERQAWVIDMRYIGGLTLEETAEELGVSRRTVIDDQRVAMAFLRREMARVPR